jgi:hypothetical protein
MDRVAVLDVEHGVTYAETLPQFAAGNRKGGGDHAGAPAGSDTRTGRLLNIILYDFRIV